MAATPSPVTPDQFKALIPSNTAGACEAFAKALIGIPTRIWELMSWLLTADGFISKNALTTVQKPGDLIFSAAILSEDANRLLCDGRTLQVSAYPALAAALAASGLTFDLPNYKDRFPVGAGLTYQVGATGGEAEHAIVKAELPLLAGSIAAPANKAFILGAAGDPVQVSEYESGEGNGWGFDNEGGVPVALLALDFTIDGTGPEADLATPMSLLPPYVACYIYIAT